MGRTDCQHCHPHHDGHQHHHQYAHQDAHQDPHQDDHQHCHHHQVSICAGANVYEPWAALLVGAGAGGVYAGVHSLMIR